MHIYNLIQVMVAFIQRRQKRASFYIEGFTFQIELLSMRFFFLACLITIFLRFSTHFIITILYLVLFARVSYCIFIDFLFAILIIDYNFSGNCLRISH